MRSRSGFQPSDEGVILGSFERIVWGSASRHGRRGIVEIIELRFALWEFLGCPGIIQNCLIREDIRLICE
jgi:hypothetical protein